MVPFWKVSTNLKRYDAVVSIAVKKEGEPNQRLADSISIFEGTTSTRQYMSEGSQVFAQRSVINTPRDTPRFGSIVHTQHRRVGNSFSFFFSFWSLTSLTCVK